MPLAISTRAEVRAAVQRNLEVYHRVVAKRQQQLQQPQHTNVAPLPGSVGSTAQSRTGAVNQAVVAL